MQLSNALIILMVGEPDQLSTMIKDITLIYRECIKMYYRQIHIRIFISKISSKLVIVQLQNFIFMYEDYTQAQDYVHFRVVSIMRRTTTYSLIKLGMIIAF